MFGFVTIRDSEVGILERKRGGLKMEPGQFVARDRLHNGIQAETLTPGAYWFNRFIWNVRKIPISYIGVGYIGIVYAIDGRPLREGQTKGAYVDCNLYQDGEAFLSNGGKKGEQARHLLPGMYRINPHLFRVLVIPEKKEDKKGINVEDNSPPADDKITAHMISRFDDLE